MRTVRNSLVESHVENIIEKALGEGEKIVVCKDAVIGFSDGIKGL